MTGELVDVLVDGAGPTGLTLAAELAAFGVRARLIDRGRKVPAALSLRSSGRPVVPLHDAECPDLARHL